MAIPLPYRDVDLDAWEKVMAVGAPITPLYVVFPEPLGGYKRRPSKMPYGKCPKRQRRLNPQMRYSIRNSYTENSKC